MSLKLKKLRGYADNIIAEMRTMIDVAKHGKRDFTAEEQAKYDDLNESLDNKIYEIRQERDRIDNDSGYIPVNQRIDGTYSENGELIPFETRQKKGLINMENRIIENKTRSS